MGREHGMHVKKAITVNRPLEEVYAFWHDFQNLPRFMSHIAVVGVLADRLTRWQTVAQDGTVIEWDVEMIEARPRELIAWQSAEGADVPNSGEVHFRPAPGGRGTEVEVEVRYDVPAGKLGRMVARLLGKDPGQQVASDLRRFKQVLETGEVILSDATVVGDRLAQRPAQPPEQAPQLAAAVR
jgi:uncharacterized membrane protein